MNGTLDRRSFLALSAGTVAMSSLGGAAAMAAPKGGFAGFDEAIVINGLGWIGNPNLKLDAKKGKGDKTPLDYVASGIDARALRDDHASGLTAVNMTIGYVSGDMDPFEHSVKDVAAWDALIRDKSDDLLKVFTVEDILRAKKEDKIGVIYGFQNAAMMGDDARRVDVFANLGVRIIQLTYNVRNQSGDGSMEAENRGLTEFGREVVERLNEKNVIVDLSHSGEQTCLEAVAASQDPIAITHTGCRALADLPRNKTDAELRAVAEKGGVVGIYFMPFLEVGARPDAADVVRHIEHAIKVCGEDHVGFGTDGSVTQIDDMERYEVALAEEIKARRKAGISATGERPDTYPFILDLRGPGQFMKLADLLAARGHKPARIEKILGRNFLRLMKDVWA